MGIYGPGPKLKENFEKICDCTVEFVNAGDSALLLQKIKILEKTKIDFVIGFDQLSLKEAEGEISWQPLLLDHPNWAPEIPKVESEFFAPYDWSPLTFIYRKQEVSPQSSFFDFLKKSELTKGISLQDPRLSTPGQQFLLWAEYLKRGSAEEFWSLMKPLVHSYSSSWSNSYGLFQRKKAKVTFSYLTSPIYHWKVDQ
ncbi:MAG: thiamine ABC transporter substrate-binding protein, partial [Bdellovibrionales bacterium]|nr:thiamine ABC transporter substrate-binding protein [Bdellovibrionales bacterium]